MKFGNSLRQLMVWCFCALSIGAALARAQSAGSASIPIDLPTALRLAGAQSIDVQIARERLKEAQANQESATENFFPWVAPGVAYHRRDGMAQAVPAGTVSDTHLQSYAPGATFTGQVALGDAIYQELASKQLVKASEQGFAAQRQDSMLGAAQGYFELLKAQMLIQVVKEALSVSGQYQQELHAAVAAGIAFRGDELRVQTQTESYRVALSQALEQKRLAAAGLALVLHLDSAVDLEPQDTDLTPLALISADADVHGFIQQALAARPELKQNQALVGAARDLTDGAVYGPLVPSLGAQVFVGGFGGGHANEPSHFGDAQDYLLGLSWRIGPGGLLDFGRVKATKARLAAAQWDATKIEDTIASEVTAALTQIRSLSEQIALTKQNLSTADETLRLTRQRKQYGVGIVLEVIQAEQELTRARSAYLSAIADFDKAQYALNKAVGGSADSLAP